VALSVVLLAGCGAQKSNTLNSASSSSASAARRSSETAVRAVFDRIRAAWVAQDEAKACSYVRQGEVTTCLAKLEAPPQYLAQSWSNAKVDAVIVKGSTATVTATLNEVDAPDAVLSGGPEQLHFVYQEGRWAWDQNPASPENGQHIASPRMLVQDAAAEKTVSALAKELEACHAQVGGEYSSAMECVARRPPPRRRTRRHRLHVHGKRHIPIGRSVCDRQDQWRRRIANLLAARRRSLWSQWHMVVRFAISDMAMPVGLVVMTQPKWSTS
jgi:hypothetical protein